MSSNEIIDSLKCCQDKIDNAVKHIDFQKNEIERLKLEKEALMKNKYKHYQLEAIKDFAEKLKTKVWDADTRCGFVQVVDLNDIEELLEQMTQILEQDDRP